MEALLDHTRGISFSIYQLGCSTNNEALISASSTLAADHEPFISNPFEFLSNLGPVGTKRLVSAFKRSELAPLIFAASTM